MQVKQHVIQVRVIIMHCIFHGLIKLQDNSAETLYVSSNVS